MTQTPNTPDFVNHWNHHTPEETAAHFGLTPRAAIRRASHLRKLGHPIADKRTGGPRAGAGRPTTAVTLRVPLSVAPLLEALLKYHTNQALHSLPEGTWPTNAEIDTLLHDLQQKLAAA